VLQYPSGASSEGESCGRGRQQLYNRLALEALASSHILAKVLIIG